MNATAQASAHPVSGPKLDNRRVLAGLLDLLIVGVVAAVVLFAGDALSGGQADIAGPLRAVILGWALYYYFAMESGDGQTIGKKVMNLRVVRADGRPVGMREVAVRTVLRVIDGIGLYIVGLIVMLVTGEKRQRVGDLAAGTIVVDAKTPASAPPAPPVASEPEVADDEVADDQPAHDEPVDEEPVDEPAPEPAADGPTITLPSRPAPPATVADLSAPGAEAPAVPEMRPFPPVDEPVAEEAPAESAAVEEEAPVPPAPAAYEAPAVDEALVVEETPVADEPAGLEPVADERDEGAEVIELTPPEVEEPGEEATVLEFAPPSGDEQPTGDEPPAAHAEDDLPEITSPSLEALARDVAAAHTEPELEVVESEDADEGAAEDKPVTIRSVETVSAIDLVMGGASEDEDPSDDPPASA